MKCMLHGLLFFPGFKYNLLSFKNKGYYDKVHAFWYNMLTYSYKHPKGILKLDLRNFGGTGRKKR